MAGPGPAAAGGLQGPAGRVNVHAAVFNPVQHHYAPPVAPANPVSAARDQQIAVGVNTWAQDFAQYNAARQQQQQAAAAGIHIPPGQLIQHHHLEHALTAPNGNTATNMQPNFGFPPVYGPTNGGFHDPAMAAIGRPAREADFNNELDKWMHVHGDTSASSAHTKAMEDVDAIMEQIARDLELQQSPPGVAENLSLATPLDTAAAMGTTLEQTPLSPALENAHFTDLEAPEMQNLTISSPEQPVTITDTQKTPETGVKPMSDVAQAAGRLLDSVKDEDGDKWKNSAFLSLMRDLRDGKKDIVDNKVRDTDEDDAAGAPDSNGKGLAGSSS